ncbi:type I secretion system permease/ATPase [Thiomicrospira microaerophila]|uniref:type I secretion system permease/ATPase n=1 Tax=Thiomicrospira microaerophila TaxID=406020 RepID=UPI0005CA203F|nr:type I secretion system permease/ATPase [Thiomicrospira microaerophila]
MNHEGDAQCNETSRRHIELEDGLLACLVLYTQLYQREPFSKDALVAGLPFVSSRLSPDLFLRAAERAGIHAAFKKRDLSCIPSLVLPCILALKDNQACLLTAIDQTAKTATIIASDAPEGSVTVALDQLAQSYAGYAIYLTKKHQQVTKKDALVARRDGHWFWQTFWQNRAIYRDVLIASLVINLFVLANPLFVMNVYDRIVPNNALESLWVLALGVSVIYAFDVLLKYLRTYFLEVAGKKSDVIMSSRLFEQTLGLTMANRGGTVGGFANNLKEFDSIRQFFTSGTLSTLVDLPFLVIFLLVIYFIAGDIVWVPIIIIAIIALYSLMMLRPIQRSIEATYEAQNQKNAVLIESLTAMPTIKAMGVESVAQWRWEQAVGEIARTSLKAKMLQSSISRMTGFMQQMSMVAVVVAGVYMITEGDLSMGALIAAVILSQRAIAPMGQIANLVTQYEQTKTALGVLNELMQREVERPLDKHFIQHPVFEGGIEFVDVTFTYPGETTPVLKNVSFKINPGEKVGIIGRIGSGKSTIEKLVMGFYSVDSGSILVDGIDINQLDPAELRRHINYVPQDVVLFSGDIRQNIAYRAPYVEDEVILRAAKVAGVDEFVKRHPKGYGFELNEGGTNLSGGQRQSIGIARALLLDAPFLLLDEPTNAMDSKTEQDLLSRLAQHQSTSTLLLVTHKMTVLQLVDRVLVIEQGRLVVDGEKQVVLKKLQAQNAQAKQGGADV